MRHALFSALTLIALSACTGGDHPSNVFVATNGNRVVPLETPGTFEVLSNPGDGGAQFFCAAADYSYRQLGARQTDRVVIVRPVGDSLSAPGTRGVVFALRTRDEAPSTRGLFMNPRQTGQAASVGHARHVCERSARRGSTTW